MWGCGYKRKRTLEEFNVLKVIDIIRKNETYNQDVLQCFEKIMNYSNELYDHSLNVSILSMLVGKLCYSNEEELTELFISALFHDFGKIYIPKSIHEKPDQLTTEERKTIELHPAVGYFYLKQQTNFRENILLGVLEHHEKADGSGYGFNKKSTEISSCAKIIAITDVYDAMVSDRCYRQRIAPDIAEKYIQNNVKNHFEVVLVERFFKAMDMLAEENGIEHLKQQFKGKMEVLQCQFACR